MCSKSIGIKTPHSHLHIYSVVAGHFRCMYKNYYGLMIPYMVSCCIIMTSPKLNMSTWWWLGNTVWAATLQCHLHLWTLNLVHWCWVSRRIAASFIDFSTYLFWNTEEWCSITRYGTSIIHKNTQTIYGVMWVWDSISKTPPEAQHPQNKRITNR